VGSSGLYYWVYSACLLWYFMYDRGT
jgi:hypothetical protein